MAWGYWSATSVLPDRGRSPRRQATTSSVAAAPVPVATAPAAPGASSELNEGNGQANSVVGSTSSEETEELPSRRPSLELAGPQSALAAVLCNTGTGSRVNSLPRRYIPDDREIIVNQHECFVHAHHQHQPQYVHCHIHNRDRLRTTDGLSDSEEESSDPGYASGIKMFTLCSDNEDDGSEPGYESGWLTYIRFTLLINMHCCCSIIVYTVLYSFLPANTILYVSIMLFKRPAIKYKNDT